MNSKNTSRLNKLKILLTLLVSSIKRGRIMIYSRLLRLSTFEILNRMISKCNRKKKIFLFVFLLLYSHMCVNQSCTQGFDSSLLLFCFSICASIHLGSFFFHSLLDCFSSLRSFGGDAKAKLKSYRTRALADTSLSLFSTIITLF